MVAEVQGFTREYAREFVSKILSDKKQIEAIVRFDPYEDLNRDVDDNETEFADDGEWGNGDDENDDDNDEDRDQIHSCPILLSILCLLVQHDQIAVKMKNNSFGEVYARMIHCLYVKYLKRKGITFHVSQFVEVVKKVGKFALQTLLSGNPLMQRSDVIRDVGEDAFEYGFLIGHEDCRLIRDETADVIVTFAHRTIQEFFAAFFFILTLNETGDMENILGESTFLENPLFFHFCMYIMYNSKILFDNICLARAHERLQNLVLKKIKFAQLEFSKIASSYPSLNLALACNRNDRLSLKFFAEVLLKCNKVKNLVLNSRAASWAFRTMNVESLSSISLSGISFCAPHCNDSNRFHLEIALRHLTDKSYNAIAEIVDILSTTNKNVLIFVLPRENDDNTVAISRLLRMKVTELHIGQNFNVSGQLEVPLVECPSLTRLSLCDMTYDSKRTFIRALTQDKLPNLIYLCMAGYEILIENLLRALATHTKIKHLKMLDFDPNEIIMGILCLSLSKKLLSLHLSFPNDSMGIRGMAGLFERSWSNLQALSLKCEPFEEGKMNQGISVIKQLTDCSGMIPGLSTLRLVNHISCISYLKSLTQIIVNQKLLHLDISQSPGVKGNLHMLLCHGFPSREVFILSGCELIADDLRSLAEANANGQLPRLKHLDVSCNEDLDLRDLFQLNCKWNHLLKLNAELLYDTSNFRWLSDKVNSGCLGSLQELRLWAPHHKHDLFTTPLPLQHLHRLEIVLLDYNCDGGYVFGSLANSYKRGDLPALRMVLLLTNFPEYSLMELGLSESKEALRRCDVSLYIGRIEDEPFFP